MRHLFSKLSLLGLLGCGVFGACADQPDDETIGHVDTATATAAASIPTLPARSLTITAASVLEPCLSNAGLTSCGSGGESAFSLRRTLGAVLRSAGLPTTSSGESPMNALARQLWDTWNDQAGAQTALSNPQCDDTVDGAGLATLNGFPIQCPRNEGAMATAGTDLLTQSSSAYFYPIALVNRLDLHDAAATTCGEYRIVYGRKDVAPGPTGRALLIFEAALPNPRPSLGLAGCAPIAQLWAGLSDPAVSATDAKNTLVRFYYQGVTVTYPDGVTATTMPVVHVDNLGVRRGQIRANAFMNGGDEARWQLREFKAQLAATGRLTLRPEYVKANPWPGLFATATGIDLFSAWFVGQVPNLITGDLNTFFLEDRPAFGAGQSDAQTGAIEGPAGDPTQFSNDYGLFASPALTLSVQARLTSLGSTLTPANVYARATAMSCGGCHQHSNNDNLGGGLVWPPSAVFVHVNETPAAATAQPDAFGQATRSFQISPALINVFLPARNANLRCIAFGECPPTPLTTGLRAN